MALFPRPLFCPACLIEIDRSAVAWRRSTGPGESEAVGTRPLVTPRRGRSPAELMDRTDEYPVCPRGHPFPFDYPDSPRCVVALVGPSLSMKSHWIARTARDVREGLLDLPTPSTRVLWTPTDQTTESLARDYDPVWSKQTILPRTTPAVATGSEVRDPLAFSADIETLDPRLLRPTDRRKYLLLFDAPGEALVGTAAQRKRFAPYLIDADLVIFFVDVLLMASLRDELRDVVPPAVHRDYAGGSFDPRVVTACADLIRTRNNVRRTKRAPSPAIALVTKGDLLPHTSVRLTGTRSGRSLADLTVAERSAIAEQVVHERAPGLYQPLDRGFRSVEFHLASAVGAQPGPDGRLPDAEGWGCSEALVAGLDRVGFFSRMGR